MASHVIHRISKSYGVVYAWKIYLIVVIRDIVVDLGSMEWSCETLNVLDSVERS